MAMAVLVKPRKRRPKPVRAYWREECPADILTWRDRQAHLLSVLENYDIDGECIVKDLGWAQGWEIVVGFPTRLAAREWWRREKGDEDARLPIEPQL